MPMRIDARTVAKRRSTECWRQNNAQTSTKQSLKHPTTREKHAPPRFRERARRLIANAVRSGGKMHHNANSNLLVSRPAMSHRPASITHHSQCPPGTVVSAAAANQ